MSPERVDKVRSVFNLLPGEEISVTNDEVNYYSISDQKNIRVEYTDYLDILQLEDGTKCYVEKGIFPEKTNRRKQMIKRT